MLFIDAFKLGPRLMAGPLNYDDITEGIDPVLVDAVWHYSDEDPSAARFLGTYNIGDEFTVPFSTEVDRDITVRVIARFLDGTPTLQANEYALAPSVTFSSTRVDHVPKIYLARTATWKGALIGIDNWPRFARVRKVESAFSLAGLDAKNDGYVLRVFDIDQGWNRDVSTHSIVSNEITDYFEWFRDYTNPLSAGPSGFSSHRRFMRVAHSFQSSVRAVGATYYDRLGALRFTPWSDVLQFTYATNPATNVGGSEPEETEFGVGLPGSAFGWNDYELTIGLPDAYPPPATASDPANWDHLASAESLTFARGRELMSATPYTGGIVTPGPEPQWMSGPKVWRGPMVLQPWTEFASDKLRPQQIGSPTGTGAIFNHDPLQIYTGDDEAEVYASLRVDTVGNVVLGLGDGNSFTPGTGIAAAATAGFAWVPKFIGTPTGVPAPIYPGHVALGVFGGQIHLNSGSGWGVGSVATKWNTIASPDGNLALSHAAHTTAFTWNATTGSSVDLFTLQNTTDDTGTGALVAIKTPGTANAKTPLQVTAATNSRFEVSPTGTVNVYAGPAGTRAPTMIFNAFRGTLAAQTAVQSGDALGVLGFIGSAETGVGTDAAQGGTFGLLATTNWDETPTVKAAFRWQTRDSSQSLAVRNRMWLTSLGYLGIGNNLAVTDVTARLHVKADIADTIGFILEAPSSGTADIARILNQSGGASVYIHSTGHVTVGSSSAGAGCLSVAKTAAADPSVEYALSVALALANTGAVGNAIAASFALVDQSTASHTGAIVISTSYSHSVAGNTSATAYSWHATSTIALDQTAFYHQYIKGPAISASKTLGTYYGTYYAATSGAGAVTTRYAIYKEFGAGNVHLDLGNGSDAALDIYFRNSSGNMDRLGVGTALQVLRVNAGVTALEWAAAGAGTIDGAGAANALTYWTDSDTVDDVTGSVVSATGSVTIANTLTAPSASTAYHGLKGSVVNATGSLISGVEYYGVHADASSTTTNSQPTSLYGVHSTVTHSVASTIGSAIGLNTTVLVSGTGSTTAAFVGGVVANVTLTQKTVTNAYGLLFALNGGLSGSIGTAYGASIGINNALMPVTTAYGLHITISEGATITNKYALVTTSGSGNVGFNTVTPAAALHLVGSFRADLGSDAAGDTFYRSSNNFTRLAIGTSGHFYKSTGSAPSWSALAASDIASGELALARGGTGASLTDPGADRILFWDHSAGAVTWLTVSTGLSISGTTLTATGGGTIDGSGTTNTLSYWVDSDTLGAITSSVVSGANVTWGGTQTQTLTNTSTSTTLEYLDQNITISPASASTAVQRIFSQSAIFGTAQTAGTVRMRYVSADHNQAANLTSYYDTETSFTKSASGTVTTLGGYVFSGGLTAGTATQAIGITSSLSTSGGTITTGMGFYALADNSSGTFTTYTAYRAFASGTITNLYGFASSAGFLHGFGTLTPTSTLDVVGTVNVLSNSINAITVDSSGRVGLGHLDTANDFTVGFNGGRNDIALMGAQTVGLAPAVWLKLQKSDSATLASPGDVEANEYIADISWEAYRQSAYRIVSYMRAQTAGSFADGDYAGRFTWNITPAGGTSATETLILLGNKMLVQGGPSGGSDPIYPFEVHSQGSNTSTVDVLTARRYVTSGTAAAGFGMGELHQLETHDNNIRDAARLDTRWQVATDSSRSSVYSVRTVANAGSLRERSIHGIYKALTDNTLTDVFQFAFAAGDKLGVTGVANITIIAKNSVSNNIQVYGKSCRFTAYHGGATTVGGGQWGTPYGDHALTTTGGITITFATNGTTGLDTVIFRITADTDITTLDSLFLLMNIDYVGEADLVLL